jgi:hypothetical protein
MKNSKSIINSFLLLMAILSLFLILYFAPWMRGNSTCITTEGSYLLKDKLDIISNFDSISKVNDFDEITNTKNSYIWMKKEFNFLNWIFNDKQLNSEKLKISLYFFDTDLSKTQLEATICTSNSNKSNLWQKIAKDVYVANSPHIKNSTTTIQLDPAIYGECVAPTPYYKSLCFLKVEQFAENFDFEKFISSRDKYK